MKLGIIDVLVTEKFTAARLALRQPRREHEGGSSARRPSADFRPAAPKRRQARQGFIYTVHCAVSKFGVVGLTQSLAKRARSPGHYGECNLPRYQDVALQR